MKAVTRSHVRTPAALLLRSGQTLLMNSREEWFLLLKALQGCRRLAWGADSQQCLFTCCDRHLGLNIGAQRHMLIESVWPTRWMVYCELPYKAQHGLWDQTRAFMLYSNKGVLSLLSRILS